ncbi:hypothetical protein SpCBS45565_g07239 [Spizellomyces sp. 'palustris']|nr:hypothetical protein SpCBS45565_g07239 [Spizellomyces sp. 'palustris']
MLKRQALDILNSLLTKSKENKALLTSHTCLTDLENLVHLLKNAGGFCHITVFSLTHFILTKSTYSLHPDVELQTQLVELLFRLCPKPKQQRLQFIETLHLPKTFAVIRSDSFHQDCRAFLNQLNAGNDGVLKTPKSFRLSHAECVLGDTASSLTLSPPDGADSLWLDFNTSSLSILVMIAGGEILSIELAFSKVQRWQAESSADAVSFVLSLSEPIILTTSGWQTGNEPVTNKFKFSVHPEPLALPTGLSRISIAMEELGSNTCHTVAAIETIFKSRNLLQCRQKTSVPASRPLPSRSEGSMEDFDILFKKDQGGSQCVKSSRSQISGKRMGFNGENTPESTDIHPFYERHSIRKITSSPLRAKNDSIGFSVSADKYTACDAAVKPGQRDKGLDLSMHVNGGEAVASTKRQKRYAAQLSSAAFCGKADPNIRLEEPILSSGQESAVESSFGSLGGTNFDVIFTCSSLDERLQTQKKNITVNAANEGLFSRLNSSATNAIFTGMAEIYERKLGHRETAIQGVVYSSIDQMAREASFTSDSVSARQTAIRSHIAHIWNYEGVIRKDLKRLMDEAENAEVPSDELSDGYRP